ncbi:hypothetical protein KC327_g92 [Hortaea werneckii]|nr:hypothetical protein KC327_g92 [Hortaea werneckii]
MLRRLKSSSGVNLGLPPKTEILLYVPLTPMQRFWYTRLLTKTDNATLDDLFRGAKEETLAEDALQRQEIQALERRAAMADGTDQSTGANGDGDVWAESKEIMQQALENKNEEDVKKGSWQKLLNLVMQLRMVCSHPYLVKGAEPDPYYLGEHIRTASGKFIVLDKLIDELVLKQQKKIIIFSQFTKTLNYVEDLMALKGGNTYDATFRYSRLDGSTARARRNLGIRMFNDSKSEFKVMLISTRAGGLGINLASATNVIFMDEDWNPQMTIQAEARAHRIGQTQPVTVYKICTQGTVEEQMMGRIRKKLYLSTKVTESMRNIHTAADTSAGNKRKHSEMAQPAEADEPQLGTNALKLLLRKGAQTLVKPEVDVTAMLGWSFQEMIENCREDSEGQNAAAQSNETVAEPDEQSWLNSMEKVETAVFEGKRHQKKVDQAMKEEAEYNRADRRIGKNTTVKVNGFDISKESMGCADWEAVATFAGKDPRLAEPVREKKAKIDHQDYCQHCMDGGEILLQGAAAEAARAKQLVLCRWCENGYCEDCLDFDTAQLVGPTLPELEMLGFGAVDQAWLTRNLSLRWRMLLEDIGRSVAQTSGSIALNCGNDRLSTARRLLVTIRYLGLAQVSPRSAAPGSYPGRPAPALQDPPHATKPRKIKHAQFIKKLQRPRGVGQCFVRKTFAGDAADADDVGCHECGGGEAEGGVEGDGAADVDQGEGDGEAGCGDDGVDWDVEFDAHAFEPAGEGEPVVSVNVRECEHLARSRGDHADCGCGLGILERCLEHIDERVSRLDGVLNGSDVEDDGEGHDKGQRRIHEIRPQHCLWDHNGSVLDFFREMSHRVGSKVEILNRQRPTAVAMVNRVACHLVGNPPQRRSARPSYSTIRCRRTESVANQGARTPRPNGTALFAISRHDPAEERKTSDIITNSCPVQLQINDQKIPDGPPLISAGPLAVSRISQFPITHDLLLLAHPLHVDAVPRRAACDSSPGRGDGCFVFCCCGVDKQWGT